VVESGHYVVCKYCERRIFDRPMEERLDPHEVCSNCDKDFSLDSECGKISDNWMLCVSCWSRHGHDEVFLTRLDSRKSLDELFCG
jgi:hypothetical protein